MSRIPSSSRVSSPLAALAAAALVAASPAVNAQAQEKAEPVVRVSIPPLTDGGPFTGTLIMYFMREDAALPNTALPADAPFYDDPQPVFSMQVRGARGGDVIEFRPTSGFPGDFADLPNSRYRAQVALDREQSHSCWLQEMSNLLAPVRWFEISEDDREPFVQFPMLNNGPTGLPTINGVEVLRVDSPTMSAFRGGNAAFDVGVVYPRDYDPERAYSAVYLLPGLAMTREFGGDYRESFRFGIERVRRPEKHHALWDDSFIITVSPQAKWGHGMWSDSPANGPLAQALINDIIPALEDRLPLVADPDARLLWGSGSGGWAAVWLQMNFPDVFGGAWATSPDPVDFRAFQSTDIYADDNYFTTPNGQPRAFYRKGGVVRTTAREASQMEEVIGPGMTSGRQLASWQAAFGPVDSGGKPARLFDPATGAINSRVAQEWRERDIGDLLRASPDKYGPIFRDRVRIVAGDADNFYLHRAVELLKADASSLGYSNGAGYIRVEQGKDHGQVEETARDQMLTEMQEHLRSTRVLENR